MVKEGRGAVRMRPVRVRDLAQKEAMDVRRDE